MQTSNPALLPDPALFDVTTVAKAPVEGSIERVELDALASPRTRAARSPAKGSSASLAC